MVFVAGFVLWVLKTYGCSETADGAGMDVTRSKEVQGEQERVSDGSQAKTAGRAAAQRTPDGADPEKEGEADDG